VTQKFAAEATFPPVKLANSITQVPTAVTDKDLPEFFEIKPLNYGLLLTSDQQTEHTHRTSPDRKQYLAEREGGPATFRHATCTNTGPHLCSWPAAAHQRYWYRMQ